MMALTVVATRDRSFFLKQIDGKLSLKESRNFVLSSNSVELDVAGSWMGLFDCLDAS